jgi:hypothetical protein
MSQKLWGFGSGSSNHHPHIALCTVLEGGT